MAGSEHGQRLGGSSKMTTKPWYVLVRPDNGYPVLIYPEKERAELIASKNGYKVVPVVPMKREK